MLLTSTKSEIDRLLGKPVMGRNIFGLAGERAFKYRQGDFDIVVGFLNDVARYCASVRRSGPLKELSPSELAIVLSLNAPAALWTVEMAEAPARTARTTAKGKAAAKTTQPLRTTYLRYVERDPKIKDKIIFEIQGWMPARKAYAFFCLPAMDGQPPLLASEWAVNQGVG
jgi:hypothetical protein